MGQLQSPESSAGLYPFERFSDRAKAILATAQQEAVKTGEGYFDTDHLVLALVTERDSVAWVTLVRLGVDADRVRIALVSHWDDGALPSLPAARVASPYTLPVPRVKRVIASAFVCADEAGRKRVGTGDLLIGVLTNREGFGAKKLVEAGATVEGARRIVADVVSEGQFIADS